ncbi:sulfite exporter TauE/SafE family protein [Olivibacter sp. XZL3]|uniref:sulfite exporter TauE/SafE family protein n=1 Tax=Olivibacter sp. XZL3 TaxID=1735116 RepID=UPI0010669564|nr:sulfite exporter TauE/SafE family protein [Olivibacter sp. XZL3]
MLTIGFIAASCIGISLGLIGGGGSILTVPVLVYLFGFDPLIATLYSLFIVGITSAMGTLGYMAKREVCYSTALAIGLASVTTVLLMRYFVLPSIPSVLYRSQGMVISRNSATMFLFALVMLVSAYLMINQKAIHQQAVKQKNARVGRLLLYGAGVGIITGLLGAGGGFLLIPTFVILLTFPMQKAIGTSLLIITMNSLIGFLSDVHRYEIAWPDLLWITALASVGVLIGAFLSKKITGVKLKKSFGFFVLAVSVFILFKEGVSYIN